MGVQKVWGLLRVGGCKWFWGKQGAGAGGCRVWEVSAWGLGWQGAGTPRTGGAARGWGCARFASVPSCPGDAQGLGLQWEQPHVQPQHLCRASPTGTPPPTQPGLGVPPPHTASSRLPRVAAQHRHHGDAHGGGSLPTLGARCIHPVRPVPAGGALKVSLPPKKNPTTMLLLASASPANFPAS